MTIDAHVMYIVMGGGVFLFVVLVVSAFSSGKREIERRLERVGPQGAVRKVNMSDRSGPQSLRSTKDSGIPLLDQMVKFLPNPAKIRSRLARTGRDFNLGEYFLMNALGILSFWFIFHMLHWNPIIAVPACIGLGLGVPHFLIGFLGNRRIKKFLASFPEAIDTMTRGIRSGLPITESIAAVGREMPDPIGIEFHRISDGVRLGRTLEASMWEVARRVDAPEYRFLIIAMAIQKETGGNLAETLGNLSDLIRKRRQLRLKIKAMSAEAKASAMIIGSLPFIMFTLLLIVNSDYIMTLFHDTRGKVLLGIGLTWMSIGWATMTKMIHFEL